MRRGQKPVFLEFRPERAVIRQQEIDPKRYYPADIYRKPNPVFPKGFKIDLKKMLREKIMTRVRTIFGYDD